MDLNKAKQDMDALEAKARRREDAPEDALINIDDGANADWLRSMAWDMWVGSPPRLVKTLPDLLTALGVAREGEAVQRQTVLKFLKLPVARPMPSELRKELKDKGWG